MAYLTVRIKGEDGYYKERLDKDRQTVGRSSSADITIRHSSLSKEHCVLVRTEDGGWTIEDLGSSNGTKVNKQPVAGASALTERDMIACGMVRLTFHSDERAAAPAIAIAQVDTPTTPERHCMPSDPDRAIPCVKCTGWMSTAHRRPGDQIRCPRCQAMQTVPLLITAET